MQVEIRNLGLAAFIKMKGYKLLEVGKYSFSFELKENQTEKTLQLEYYNSLCSMHDVEVCNLRDMQRFIRERD